MYDIEGIILIWNTDVIFNPGDGERTFSIQRSFNS